MDDLDRRIVNRLQRGIPVCERPYAEPARELGLDEATLLERIRALRESGVLTRFGPLFDAERLGGAFCLCALSAPAMDYERIAGIVNAHPEVAHNYERTHALNMWFVLATETGEGIDRAIRRIESETGLAVLALPRLDEYYIGLQLAA